MATMTRLDGDKSYYAVIVDTNAFITGSILSLPGTLLSSPLLTTDAVKAEVRDKRAMQVLDTLPFELKTRLPAETSIAAVTKFAKATGDLASLSPVDLQVIALTHQLEIEANGTKYVRSEPPDRETTFGLYHKPAPAPLPTGDLPPCRYFNTAKGCRRGAECRYPHIGEPGGSTATSGGVPAATDAPSHAEAVAEGLETEAWETVPVKTKVTKRKGAKAEAPKTSTAPEVSAAPDKPVETAPIVSVAPVPEAVKPEETPEEDDDGDSGEWILPAESGPAFHEVLPFGKEFLAATGGVGDEAKDLANDRKLVVCITSDFPMQNVLLQMGLNLASPTGQLIRAVRQWVKKCDACFTIVTDMTKLFCPKCGNATLARLGVTLAADGTPRFHYKKNRTFNLRGTNYALPAPKGGREGGLLLREDQLLTGYWAQKNRKKVVTTSVFAERAFGEDAPSTGIGLTTVTKADIVVGYGRKNPNEVRHRKR